jgi:uncharacterized protein (TIGR02145 family)
MKNVFLRHAFLPLLGAAFLVSTSCDSKSSASGSTESITTNFSVNLTSLMESIGGKPDSIVAEVQVDGATVQVLSLDPSKISGSGLVRFPVDAAEGSKVQVVYKVWDAGGVAAAGSVTWVSGEALTVPSPNLAPTVSFDGVAGQELMVRRNAKVWVRTSSRDKENSLASLGIDWNGDGVVDDSLVPPKSQDSIQVSWGVAGRYLVTAIVRDKAGLFRTDTLMVQVLSAATVRLSGVDSASVGDTVVVDVAVAFDDLTQASGTRLVWTVPGASPETTEVQATRSFLWTTAAARELIVSTVDTLGEIHRDTLEVTIVLDAPILDLSRFPNLTDPGTSTLLPIGFSQAFGSIVRWGIDFDGDTTAGWDSSSVGSPSSVAHLFPLAGPYPVRVFVVDDDGNRVVASKEVWVSSSTGGQVLQLTSPKDLDVSVFDTTEFRFQRNFPPGAEALSRLEWRVDGGEPRSEEITISKRLTWTTPGAHTFSWRVVMPAGATLWEEVRVAVALDAPVLDLSDLPSRVARNVPTSFAPRVSQKYGRVVGWGIDFDADTTNGWDSTVAGNLGAVVHTFAELGPSRMLIVATDDDGNRVVASHSFVVQAEGSDLLLRTSPDTQIVSIGDSVGIRFVLNFPDFATRSASRLEWTTDALPSQVLAVDTARTLPPWSLPGTHVVRTRVLGPSGTTSLDSTVVVVVSDPPVLDLSEFPDTAGVDATTRLHATSSQRFGTITSWRFDLDGDTTSGWDRTGTGPLPDAIIHSFPTVGDFTVLVSVTDDDGNRVSASKVVPVRKGNFGIIQKASSSDTVLSIGDSLVVRLSLNFQDLSQQSRSRLVWKIDGQVPETLQVASSRGFQWPTAGRHVLRFHALGDFGVTGWDSVVATVVLDPPVPDLSGLPAVVDRNGVTTFLPAASQSFGRIVRWGVDWDADTTGGWDVEDTKAFRAISRIFPQLGSSRVLFYAQDDDSNLVVSWKDVVVRASVAGGVLTLGDEDQRTQSVSIGDSVKVSFRNAFPAGVSESYRIEWMVDSVGEPSTAILPARAFVWPTAGSHRIKFRANGPLGPTSWDSIQAAVEQGVPRILAIQRLGSGVGKDILFSATVDPVYGSIVRARWDFGNDGTWDDSVASVADQVNRSFPTSAPIAIRYQVQDDDGNIADTLLTFVPSNAAPVFGTVGFTEASVGVNVAATLRATFSDLDGNSDIVSLSLDWNNDGTWDTVRNVVGLGSDEIRRAWASIGRKTVRVKVVDRSGDTAISLAAISVLANAPAFTEISEAKGSLPSRIERWGDTLVFSVAVLDPTVAPADLVSLRWTVAGILDTSMSLAGLSSDRRTLRVPVGQPGVHTLALRATDLSGNQVDTTVSWTVVMSPPKLEARLLDTFLVSRERAVVVLDSLRPGRVGSGSIRSVAFQRKGETTWTPSNARAGGSDSIVIPAMARDRGWTLVVRAVQDNGETVYDTLVGDVLESIVDPRDSKVYPIVQIGNLKWFARNLGFVPETEFDISSKCPEGGVDCLAKGRLYSYPHPLPGQLVSRDRSQVQSICPDGWHVSSQEDWDSTIEYSRATLPELNDHQAFRTRTGWTYDVGVQTDPWRFSAEFLEPSTQWWTGTGGRAVAGGSFAASADPDTGMSGGTRILRGIRCVANRRIVMDVQLYLLSIDSVKTPGVIEVGRVRPEDDGWLRLHFLAPDPSAPVHIKATTPAGVVEWDATNSPFSFSIAKPAKPGLFPVRVEVSQGSMIQVDTFQLRSFGVLYDSRNGTTRRYRTTGVAGKVIMAEDLAYDTAGVRSWSDWTVPGVASSHYPLAVATREVFPERGSEQRVQGICPDGWHIPTPSDWSILLSEAHKLYGTYDVQRSATFSWAKLAGKDQIGMNLKPVGYWNSTDETWHTESLPYWLSDGTSLVNNGYWIQDPAEDSVFHYTPALDDFQRPRLDALPVRCMQDD